MKAIKIILICVFVLYVDVGTSEVIPLKDPEIEVYRDSGEVDSFEDDLLNDRRVNSTMYKTVNKYFCAAHSVVEGSHLIVYDNKGWTFPKQDVNLTLRYPLRPNIPIGDDTYLITGFKVILYIDGPGSKGYVMTGGVLRRTITLSFVSSGLTTLKYEFWLYGVRQDMPGLVELNNYYRIC